MSNSSVAPFVKWAGGKRQLLPQIKERMPKKYNNYFEPFVGGGAVTFELLPANALINDINKALINAYKQICNAPVAFLKAVKKLDEEMWEDGKEYYYSLREHYNDKLMKAEFDVELAALFVFINKHCFNGLYRVNGKGLFNVPYNNSRRASVDENTIMEISEYLQGVKIIDGDFEVACKDATKGDFVFIDSPYAPLNPTSFESYTKEGFDIESHKRLAKLFDELTARGCYCMLTNHNTDLINELYGNKGYRIDVVSVKRMINSDASNRVGEEVIICNYERRKQLMYNEVANWLNNVLKRDIPEEVVAFCFNLYEDGDNVWSMELVGTERFDADDEDWPCDEVTDFGTREDLLAWDKDSEWDVVLEEMCTVLRQYLENGEYAHILKSKEGIGIGFVDGDVEILFTK